MSDLQQLQNPELEPLPELTFREQMKERFDFAWTYIFIVLVGLIVIFSIWHGTKFFDRTNFRNIALDSSQLMLLAVGMTFVIITAGIDLSCSAVLVFSAVVGAKVMSRLSGSPEQVKLYDFPHQNIGIPIGLAAAVLAGLLWGIVNGLDYYQAPSSTLYRDAGHAGYGARSWPDYFRWPDGGVCPI